MYVVEQFVFRSFPLRERNLFLLSCLFAYLYAIEPHRLLQSIQTLSPSVNQWFDSESLVVSLSFWSSICFGRRWNERNHHRVPHRLSASENGVYIAYASAKACRAWLRKLVTRVGALNVAWKVDQRPKAGGLSGEKWAHLDTAATEGQRDGRLEPPPTSEVDGLGRQEIDGRRDDVEHMEVGDTSNIWRRYETTSIANWISWVHFAGTLGENVEH